MGIGDWELGIGDWELGIGDWEKCTELLRVYPRFLDYNTKILYIIIRGDFFIQHKQCV